MNFFKKTVVFFGSLLIGITLLKAQSAMPAKPAINPLMENFKKLLDDRKADFKHYQGSLYKNDTESKTIFYNGLEKMGAGYAFVQDHTSEHYKAYVLTYDLKKDSEAAAFKDLLQPLLNEFKRLAATGTYKLNERNNTESGHVTELLDGTTGDEVLSLMQNQEKGSLVFLTP